MVAGHLLSDPATDVVSGPITTPVVPLGDQRRDAAGCAVTL